MKTKANISCLLAATGEAFHVLKKATMGWGNLKVLLEIPMS